MGDDDVEGVPYAGADDEVVLLYRAGAVFYAFCHRASSHVFFFLCLEATILVSSVLQGH